MQDMVIKGTGNSRFLKSVENFKELFPDYDSFAAAFAAGILPVDFNGINPDGITQMGTPYTKSAVLTDATAALFGLGDSAVPNDVFTWIGEWGRANWKLLAKYDTAGAFTFIVPDDVDELGVFVLGGGSSGATATYPNGNGGKSARGGDSGGLMQFVLKKSNGDFADGEEISVVVGAGGIGTQLTSADAYADSRSGGTSSFAGRVSGSGQPADRPNSTFALSAPYGLVEYLESVLDYEHIHAPVRDAPSGYRGINIFDPNDRHIYCGAGGFAVGYYTAAGASPGVSNVRYQSTVSRVHGSAGAGSEANGGNATAHGDGGGGAAGYASAKPTSGNGADGLVMVYGRKVV